MGYEIERKFLITRLPDNLDSYPQRRITQGYLCRHPAIRVRKDEDLYYMTYKGVRKEGHLAQEEYNLPLSSEAYSHLLQKADGTVIEKTRYMITHGERTIELDVFSGELEGLIVAEVEFSSEEEAMRYVPAPFMGREVTGDFRYSNAWMAGHGAPMDDGR